MAFYICSNCGEGSATWMGKCPACGQWDTFKQHREGKDASGSSEQTKKLNVTSLKKVKAVDTTRKKTGIFEFDRILGGGFVAGEAVLLTGEPGVGKSTLLLQSLQNLRTLYISGEEAAEQVKDRADRLGVKLDDVMFSDTLQIEGIIDGVEEMKKEIDLVVIDSIQTVYSKEVDSAPGSVSQLRESSMKLIRMAKNTKIPIIIIGHVTKEGEVAGPKTLEHMVDAVLNFEGERVSAHRILRAQKNRFGTTDEIGIFEMKGQGLVEVNNPLAFVEDDMQIKVPGKALVGVMEGKRPLFFEIQTLAVPTILAVPRRVVKGVDYNKVLLLLAVLQKQLHISFAKYDIYVNVVGGVDVKTTAADLGIAASIISSVKDIPLSPTTMFTGEVGLLGEIRKVYGQERIISEGKRLNFKLIYSSQNSKTIREMYKELTK